MMTHQQPWPGPPAAVRLEADEAHVWLASLDVAAETLSSLRALLNPGELDRADRFSQAHHRTHSAVTRGCLRSLLGTYQDLPPQAIEFEFGSHGKPFLSSTHKDTGLRFNVSHSYGLALFAFARGCDIGVDIEKIREDRPAEKIADRFFAASEAARLRSLPDWQRPQAFFECWTRKEAYVKARGQGLSIPLKSFEVAFGPGMPPSIRSPGGGADPLEHWSLFDLDPSPGFAGALAVGRPPRVVRCWRFTP